MFDRVHGPESFPEKAPGSRAADSHLPLELQELVEQQAASCAVMNDATSSDWPVSIYVPERYEENYAYPLIVWFHDTGHHDGQIESFLEAVSPQNYCGLGIQGNVALQSPHAFDWNPDALEYGPVRLRDLLSVTVRRMRQAFHIHSERIFLAGCGTGADIALTQLGQAPQWYAGGVLLNPACGRPAMDALMTARLSGLPLLWTVPENASGPHLARHVEAVQLARMAGAVPEVRVTNRELDPESPDVRFLDQWLLSHLTGRMWS